MLEQAVFFCIAVADFMTMALVAHSKLKIQLQDTFSSQLINAIQYLIVDPYSLDTYQFVHIINMKSAQ